MEIEIKHYCSCSFETSNDKKMIKQWNVHTINGFIFISNMTHFDILTFLDIKLWNLIKFLNFSIKENLR